MIFDFAGDALSAESSEVFHPSELKWPDHDVVGAERVHRIFRGWLAELGQSAYASEVPSPGESTRVST